MTVCQSWPVRRRGHAMARQFNGRGARRAGCAGSTAPPDITSGRRSTEPHVSGSYRNDADRFISTLVSLNEVEDRVRYLAELGVASTQFISDVHGHVTGPAFGGVEGDDADRLAVLAVH